MGKYVLEPFGKFNLYSLEEYYETEIDFNGNIVTLDLNFEKEEIEKSRLDIVKEFLEILDKLDGQNKNYLERDYNEEEGINVKFYLNHHLDELTKDELAHLIDFTNEEIQPIRQLFNNLHLIRIGFYPDDTSGFAIFDYTIDKDLTNYLISITIDEEGYFVDMAVES